MTRDVPSIEAATLTAEEFRERFCAAGLPVVLRGFLRSWPACGQWTPASFAERFGDVPVEPRRSAGQVGVDDPGPYRDTVVVTLRDYVERMRAGRCDGLYLVAQSQVLRRPAFRSLWDDMPFDHAWFDERRKETHVSLWMGPAGAVTALHFDYQDGLLAQVFGRKRVLLAAPSESARLYRGPTGYSRVDPERPDFEAFPLLREAVLHAVVIEPGDALFLPEGWWHHVRSLTDSISLSMSHFAWQTGD